MERKEAMRLCEEAIEKAKKHAAELNRPCFVYVNNGKVTVTDQQPEIAHFRILPSGLLQIWGSTHTV